MLISDWSSDVCSSDLQLHQHVGEAEGGVGRRAVRGAARRDREVGPEDVAGAVDQVEVLVGGVLHAGENAGALGASRALRGLIAGCPLTRADYSAAVSCFRTKRSEEQTSELQSLMRSSYAVFCL